MDRTPRAGQGIASENSPGAIPPDRAACASPRNRCGRSYAPTNLLDAVGLCSIKRDAGASCITMPSSERLLILGATGQLGTDLLRAAAAEGVDHVGVGHEDVDVTNADSVTAGMARYRPTIVINT